MDASDRQTHEHWLLREDDQLISQSLVNHSSLTDPMSQCWRLADLHVDIATDNLMHHIWNKPPSAHLSIN